MLRFRAQPAAQLGHFYYFPLDLTVDAPRHLRIQFSFFAMTIAWEFMSLVVLQNTFDNNFLTYSETEYSLSFGSSDIRFRVFLNL